MSYISNKTTSMFVLPLEHTSTCSGRKKCVAYITPDDMDTHGITFAKHTIIMFHVPCFFSLSPLSAYGILARKPFIYNRLCRVGMESLDPECDMWDVVRGARRGLALMSIHGSSPGSKSDVM